MNISILSKTLPESFFKVLFVTFYLFLLVEFFAILYNSSAQSLTILLITVFFLITLFNAFWGLWIFVAVIPLINGFFMMKGGCDISLAFIGVYLAWLPKRLFAHKGLQHSTSVALFANLLAAILLLNLCLALIRIVDSPVPSRYWIDWFSYFPFVNQKNNLWQINAALILLKGIFLFKMIDLELRVHNCWIIFTKTVYVQAVFIAGFSLLQFVILQTKGVDYLHPELNYLKLYLPFNDIHSYGSYVVFLFCIFAYLFMQGVLSRRVGGGYQIDGQGGGNYLLFSQPVLTRLTRFLCKWSSKTYVNGLLAFIFFFFCLYSFSRTTWLVTGIIIIFLVVTVIQSKKVVVCTGIFIVFAFIAGSLSVSELFESDNPSLHRIGSFLNVNKLNRDKDLIIRGELWERSFAMIKDYPLTGVGVGNFYRNNVSYENSYFDEGYLERVFGKRHLENAHNYYLQMAAELGVPGVVLFLSLLFSLYYRQIALVRENNELLPKEISVQPFLCGLGAYLLTLFTGHPLLLSSQQFLFWAIVAIIAKGQDILSKENEILLPESKNFRRISVLIFFLFVLGFCMNVYKQEPWTIPAEYGLYSTENWNGVKMRWMAGKAEYFIPAATKRLELKVVAQPFNSQAPDGLTLTISINDSVVDKVHFIDGGTRTLSYEVSSVNKRDSKVTLEVDKVFSPRKIGLNNDFRTLGVALRLDG